MHCGATLFTQAQQIPYPSMNFIFFLPSNLGHYSCLFALFRKNSALN